MRPLGLVVLVPTPVLLAGLWGNTLCPPSKFIITPRSNRKGCLFDFDAFPGLSLILFSKLHWRGRCSGA